MAHVTRIKAGDKKSEDEPKKSTSKNVKEAVKIAKKIVKEERQAAKSDKKDKKAKKAKSEKKPMPMPLRIITFPFRMILKPFIALGRYIKGSWQEIRQVSWPNRKATWKLVFAIFVYSAFFIVLVMALDALFNFIFSKIIG